MVLTKQLGMFWDVSDAFWMMVDIISFECFKLCGCCFSSFFTVHPKAVCCREGFPYPEIQTGLCHKVVKHTVYPHQKLLVAAESDEALLSFFCSWLQALRSALGECWKRLQELEDGFATIRCTCVARFVT